MDLSGKTFRVVANAANGVVDSETRMRFESDGDVVLGSYDGGAVAAGQVLARRTPDGRLDMLYQGANVSGELQAGRATASFAPDAAGRTHMHLEWRWLTGDQSGGRSSWVLEDD